jgi:hypothetical protein
MATYLNIKMLVRNRSPRKYLEIISVKSVMTMLISEFKRLSEILTLLDMVAQACYSSTWEAKAGRLSVQGQHRMHSKTLSLKT